MQTKSSKPAFLTLITVFFFWGFVAASNDILIPVFKEALHLEQWQSQMISFAFYVAYTVGAIIYYIISKLNGSDILNRIGYKNGIALGLIISAAGTLLFYPAAEYASFNLMITGLFIVGLGFSLQQTAANPLAIVIGDRKTGAQRLSLAGGINNFGTTIGPVLVSFAIFGTITVGTTTSISIDSVKSPYLILGVFFILAAILFRLSSVPNKIEEEVPATVAAEGSKTSALHYPQLVLGMVAIFLYVGVEVSTASNLPEFMRQELNTPTGSIAPFVSLYWASLMIGRWTASVGAFDISAGSKKILRFFMPYIAFIVFLVINKVAAHDVTPFYIYALILLVIVIGDIMSRGNPATQLLLFSCLGIIALIVGITAKGMISVYAFISVGLFCSTLWPCIFTLAISGLKHHTNQGSGFLIMMIMGGGIVSLLQGYLADDGLLGIKLSFMVGVICFAYLAVYALAVRKILNRQGIGFRAADNSSAH